MESEIEERKNKERRFILKKNQETKQKTKEKKKKKIQKPELV